MMAIPEYGLRCWHSRPLDRHWCITGQPGYVLYSTILLRLPPHIPCGKISRQICLRHPTARYHACFCVRADADEAENQSRDRDLARHIRASIILRAYFVPRCSWDEHRERSCSSIWLMQQMYLRNNISSSRLSIVRHYLATTSDTL